VANEQRFTGLAAAYTRARPDYPREAFEAMTAGLPRPIRAVDVGCGTGISTRRLADFADETTGVDPNREMLEAARRASADAAARSVGDDGARTPAAIRWHAAPAESTGLASVSFELVLAAQAFHWFDPSKALGEFHRLLVPGGRVALLWNLRDDRDDTTRAYSAITVPEAKRNLDATSLAAREDTGKPLAESRRFRGYRRVEFTNEQRLDLAGVLDRAGSASYYPRSGPDRVAADARLNDLFSRESRDGVLTLRYRVELHLAERA